MAKAKVLRKYKIALEHGLLIEIAIYGIPPSKYYPEGLKYRLYLLQHGRVIVGYDNHQPKGHHVHFGMGRMTDLEEPYEFRGIDKLLEDFERHVEERLIFYSKEPKP